MKLCSPLSQRVISLGRLPRASANCFLFSGNIADYRYVDGQYVYDPLPDPEPEPDAPTLEERVEVLETTTDDMILLMADLIGGE